MKKFYSTLAVVALIAFSGSAAEKLSANNLDAAKTSQKVELNSFNIDKVQKTRSNKARKKAEAISDLYGEYKCNYYNMLTDSNLPLTLGVTISQNPDGGSAVFVSGLPYSDVDYTAYVDLDEGTLTIPKQDAYLNTYYNEMVVFCAQNAAGDSNLDKYPDPENYAMVFEILEDGTIQAQSWWQAACLKLESYISDRRSGFFFGAYDIVMEPVQYYTIDESLWEVAGTADFTDGFFAPVFVEGDSNPNTYKVSLLSNPEVEGEYALKNPYGASTAFGEVNDTPDLAGYLVFNISNPDCVTVRPLVGSGLSIDMAEEGQEPDIVEFYPFNKEGRQYYLADITPQDQIDEITIIMEDNETLRDYLSYYDEETKTVHILADNEMFAQTGEPLSQYYWIKKVPNPDKPGETMNVKNMWETTIKLNIGEGSVNDIIADDTNAPVKYFNLQGMEVKNPEAGQILIVKKGGKVSKTILK